MLSSALKTREGTSPTGSELQSRAVSDVIPPQLEDKGPKRPSCIKKHQEKNRIGGLDKSLLFGSICGIHQEVCKTMIPNSKNVSQILPTAVARCRGCKEKDDQVLALQSHSSGP